MNYWAVLLSWLFILSAMDLLGLLKDPGWAQVAIALLGVGGLVQAMRLLWKHTVYKHGNFQLRFIDHLPPNHTVHNFIDFKVLTIGEHELCCFAQSLYGFHLCEVNFRFLRVDENNVATSVIEVLSIESCFKQNFGGIVSDGEGGMEGRYSNGPALAKNQAVYFKVRVRASCPWSGVLSFRGQDLGGFRSDGKHPVRIITGL